MVEGAKSSMIWRIVGLIFFLAMAIFTYVSSG
jgi:hypothetical protein